MELPITAFDVVVLGAIVIAAFFAASRGFVHEVTSVAAWLGAAVTTLILFPALRPLFRDQIEPAILADAAGLIGIFVAALLPLSFLSYRLSELVSKGAMAPLDRALGAVWGAGTALAGFGLLFLVFTALAPDRDDQPDWLTASATYPLITGAADVMASLGTVLEPVTVEQPGTSPSQRAAPQEPAGGPARDIGSLIRETVAPEAAPTANGAAPATAPAPQPARPAATPASSGTAAAPDRDENANDSGTPTTYGPRDRRALEQLLTTTDAPTPDTPPDPEELRR